MSLVSVIMPARNAAATISESVRSVLAQPRLGELIVVNDGSSDGTAMALATIDDHRLVVVDGPCRGISAAVNAGLAAVRHDFVARCDADDLYPAGRLDWQLEWLVQNGDFAAVSGGFVPVTRLGAPIAPLACDGVGRDVTELLRGGAAVTHFCTWLTRRSALQACGGVREWFVTAEDLDLMFRLAETGRVWHEPQVAYMYRLHDASIVHSQSNVLREFFEETATVFARERRTGNTDRLAGGNPPPTPSGAGASTSATMHLVSLLEASAWQAYAAGCFGEASRQLIRAISANPGRISAWRQLAVLEFKICRSFIGGMAGHRIFARSRQEPSVSPKSGQVD